MVIGKIFEHSSYNKQTIIEIGVIYFHTKKNFTTDVANWYDGIPLSWIFDAKL